MSRPKSNRKMTSYEMTSYKMAHYKVANYKVANYQMGGLAKSTACGSAQTGFTAIRQTFRPGAS